MGSIVVYTCILPTVSASSWVMERICVSLFCVYMEGTFKEIQTDMGLCTDIFVIQQNLLKALTNTDLLYFVPISFYDHFFSPENESNYF